ncbi:MAG: FAD:protein FMN transferase, partial [Lachnospiraceae bacterium]|nr:FAD:protein FMN transferase [Lachnospiraceae bacterium]
TLYHHILSPKTGYPAESGLLQVTILSPSSIDADALSTLCFLLGYEKAASLLKNHPDLQAIFITESGEIHYINLH